MESEKELQNEANALASIRSSVAKTQAEAAHEERRAQDAETAFISENHELEAAKRRTTDVRHAIATDRKQLETLLQDIEDEKKKATDLSTVCRSLHKEGENVERIYLIS